MREKYLKSGMGKRYIKNRLKRFLSLTGFTLIEVMIAMVLLLMGLSGVSLVYITTERMRETGLRDTTMELTNIQKKSQSPDEYISHIVRLASWADVTDNGDRVDIDIPQDSTKTEMDQAGFYFEEYDSYSSEEVMGSIFYDPDRTVADDEVELYKDVYRILDEGDELPIFSQGDVVKVQFGYFKGNEVVDANKREVGFNIKMRNN